jgi:hypothetical protein
MKGARIYKKAVNIDRLFVASSAIQPMGTLDALY